MVAPYNLMKPQVSFVRVPGSGTAPDVQTVVCDLSKVADVPPANSFPRSMMPPKVQPTSELKSQAAGTKRKASAISEPAKKAKISVEELIKEKEALELDNKELKKKVALFQALFRNRTKLNELIEKLDQKEEEQRQRQQQQQQLQKPQQKEVTVN